MPTFGEFETLGEAVSVIEERGDVATVWQARRAGGVDKRPYTVKCYAARPRRAGVGGSEQALDKDRGLEFLEGIKQIKKAQSEGGVGLAPIHALGISELGAWYVTDFYPRNNLKAWILRRGGVDHAALRHVVQSVIAGCLALKRSRGYSHGNLKPSNIFLSGQPRPLRKTPLQLTDAYPAAPLQLAKLDSADQTEVGELLHQVMEAQDLRTIGELILQLVEGRLFSRSDDYNYPVARAPVWDILGKEADYWLNLCNKLVNPQLSLETVNLETLENEFRPSQLLAQAPLIAGGVAGVCLVSLTLYWAVHSIGRWRANAAKQSQAELAAWTTHNARAKDCLAQTNFALAAQEFKAATESLGARKHASERKESEQRQAFAEKLMKLKDSLDAGQSAGALAAFTPSAAELKQDQGISRWVLDNFLSRATNFATRPEPNQQDLSAADQWAQLALLVEPRNAGVTFITNRTAKTRNELAAKPWNDFSASQAYVSTRAQWENNGLGAQFDQLLRKEFDRTKAPDLKQYELPGFWPNLGPAEKTRETATFRSIAQGMDKRTYSEWRTDLERNYASITGEELGLGWGKISDVITNKIGDIQRTTSALDGTDNEFKDQLAQLNKLGQRAAGITRRASSGGGSREELKKEAAQVLKEWDDLSRQVNTHITDANKKMGQTQQLASFRNKYPWFSPDLAGQLRDAGFARFVPPKYPASVTTLPAANEMDDFRNSVQDWWRTSAVPATAVDGLPLSKTFWPLIQRAQDAPGATPDFSNSVALVASLTRRSQSIVPAKATLDALRGTWQGLTNSQEFRRTAFAWQTNDSGDFIRSLVWQEFEAAIGTNLPTLLVFSNAVTDAGRNLSLRCDTDYYALPPVWPVLEADDKKSQLAKLNDVVVGKMSYPRWVSDIQTNYGAVSGMSAVLTNWNSLDLSSLTASLSGLKSNVVRLKGFKPDLNLEVLGKSLDGVSNSVVTLENHARRGGKKRSYLMTEGTNVLAMGRDLKRQIDKVRAASRDYADAMDAEEKDYQLAEGAYKQGEYTSALNVCQKYNDKPRFVALANAIAAEQTALATNTQRFKEADYAFIQALSNQTYATKPPFRTLLQNAVVEKTLLQELDGFSKSNAWREVITKFNEPGTSDLRGKNHFKELLQWAEKQDPARTVELMVTALKVNLGMLKANVTDPWSRTGKLAAFDSQWQKNAATYYDRCDEVRKSAQKTRNPRQWDKDLKLIEGRLNSGAGGSVL